MRLAASTPGPRTIAQASVAGSQTIVPSTAFTDLLRLTGVNIHGGQPTRVTATGSVILTGTTNTVRTVFFELTHGVGAGTVLAGGAVSLADDEAATSLSTFFALNFIILAPPALPADEFALRWSTGANATANVNGTVPENGGATLNVEELTSANSVVGPTIGDVFFVARQANDAQTLLAQIQNSFASALLVDPDVQLVDIVVSGGGAGNVFLAEMCFRLPQVVEDVAYPAVSDLAVAVASGPDWASNTVALNRLVLAQPLGVLEFWANACAGDGAIWLTVQIYIAGVGEGFFAFAGASESAGVRAVRAMSGAEQPTVKLATVATPKGPVQVFSMKPAPYRIPPPPAKPPVLKS